LLVNNVKLSFISKITNVDHGFNSYMSLLTKVKFNSFYEE